MCAHLHDIYEEPSNNIRDTPMTAENSHKVLVIIGDPIHQVKSPATFGKYFQTHDIDAEMVPLHVAAQDFHRVLEGLRGVKNLGGAVITIPHKYDAYKVAHKRGPMAQATGTANILAPFDEDQWSAEMLDGVGLINALEKRSIETAGLRTLIIGAGGAGTAIAVALQQLGNVASIGITDINTKRAEELVAKLADADVVEAALPGDYQLVINASPVGMGSDEMPLDSAGFSSSTIVCDAIMHPAKTRFLREAEKRGCVIVEGLEMLHGQVESIVRFLGLQD